MAIATAPIGSSRPKTSIALRKSGRGAARAAEGGDVLLSEVELGQSGSGASGTVIGMAGDQRAAAESDLQLADSSVELAGSDLQLAGSDLQLAASDTNLVETTQGPETARKAELDSKVSQFEELDLTLDEDLTLEDSNAGHRAQASRRPAIRRST